MPEVSPYLIVPIVTIIVSQVLKFALHAFSNEIDFKQFLKFGGTPSSRIAAVSSLMVIALAVDGLGASVAGLTVFAGGLYVWEKKSRDNIKEVASGALVGFVSGLILGVTYWKNDIGWFFETPVGDEIKFGFIAFAALFVLGEILSFMTRRKSMRKLPTSRKLNRAFRLSLTLPAILGLIITFAQKETLGMFDIRLWTYLIALWVVIATGWFWWSVYRHAKAHLAEETEHFKKVKAKEKTKHKKGSKKNKRKR